MTDGRNSGDPALHGDADGVDTTPAAVDHMPLVSAPEVVADVILETVRASA